MSFLEIERAFKNYGSPTAPTEVLADINLQVERGEFIAIVGFSGAGKTTLMNLLSGLAFPDRGSVRFDGRPVVGPGPDRGLVFQNYSLLPWLTVFENIALAVDQVFPNRTADERQKHTERYIEIVNLVAARNKFPRELSGGMRQRVAVARTLAMEPQVLLLDEPLTALDALTRANLQDEITSIRRQDDKTIVLITNDPDEAILLADRVIPLTRGPRATLGPSIPVNIPRPRTRAAINHDPEFKRIRNEVIDYLLDSNEQRKIAVTKKLVLPDLLPEDLDSPRVLFGKRLPRRRSEQRIERVEVIL